MSAYEPTPEQQVLIDWSAEVFDRLRQFLVPHLGDVDVHDAIGDALVALLEWIARHPPGTPVNSDVLFEGTAREAKKNLAASARRFHGMVTLDRIPELSAPEPSDAEQDFASHTTWRAVRECRMKAMRAALRRLPAKQREAVWFRHIEGLTLSDAARKLGTKASTVCRNAGDGIANLRTILVGAVPRSRRRKR